MKRKITIYFAVFGFLFGLFNLFDSFLYITGGYELPNSIYLNYPVFVTGWTVATLLPQTFPTPDYTATTSSYLAIISISIFIFLLLISTTFWGLIGTIVGFIYTKIKKVKPDTKKTFSFKGPLRFLIAGIIIECILFGAFKIYSDSRTATMIKDGSIKQVEVNLPEPTVPLRPTMTPVPKGWKIYRNNQYNFEIKYPGEFYSAIVDPYPASKSFLVGLNPNKSFNDKKPLAVTYRIGIGARENKENLDLTLPERLFGIGLTMGYGPEVLKDKEIKTISFGGQKAYEVDDIGPGMNGTTKEIVTIVNNNIYQITVAPTQLTGDEQINKDIFDQILSTFKFNN